MTQPILIAPSILSADFARLGEDVSAVLAAGADMVHVDVMDQHFVPNLTFGSMVVGALRRYGIQAPMDVHLMTTPVDSLVPDMIAQGADYVSFHPEGTIHVDRTIQLIRSLGAKPGLALNPATPLHVLDHTLEYLDLVVVMSVNPGFGGQPFIEASLDKITHIRNRIDRLGKPIRLEVDGGVGIGNIRRVVDAGADTIVSGSAIFNTPNYANTIQLLRDQLM